MSCGKPHETPCSEVLDRVYEFIDHELDDADCAKIQEHLDECGPCLREFGLDQLVKDALQRLPEEFRLAVYLADVEGFAYKEIAEMLDIPIGTVMSRLHRGRKGLEKRLHDFVTEQHLITTEAGS